MLCNCSSSERSNHDVLVLSVTRSERASPASLKTSSPSTRVFHGASSAGWLIPCHVRSLNHRPRARSTSVTSRTRHADQGMEKSSSSVIHVWQTFNEYREFRAKERESVPRTFVERSLCVVPQNGISIDRNATFMVHRELNCVWPISGCLSFLLRRRAYTRCFSNCGVTGKQVIFHDKINKKCRINCFLEERVWKFIRYARSNCRFRFDGYVLDMI